MLNNIFVQIASYRDPQLVPTLNDMLVNAVHPENLAITVCWQHGPDETLETFTSQGFKVALEADDATNVKKSEKVHGFPIITLVKDGASINLIDVHFHKAKGACWARNTIQQLYDGEKYTMQLDSHHRFVKDWDTLVISMIESVRTPDTPKPLLTGYISSFDPENDPGARVTEPWRMDFDRFIPEGTCFFIPATIDDWQNLDKPVKGRFYSAHFGFADGIFAEEVQHDPEFFFHGEEMSIAVRAFTHGYDIFHPHRIVAYHEYTRKGRVKIWDDATTQQKLKGRVELDWVERNNACHLRNRKLFGMSNPGDDTKPIDFGKYGFGSVRTVRQYEEYAGLSFQYRGVQQATLDRSPNYKYPPNNFKYSTEEEWKNSFVGSHDLRICVHKNELELDKWFPNGEPVELEFAYLGTHDSEGKEIHRKDLDEAALKAHLQNEWVDQRFIFFADRVPVTYTLWPVAKDKTKGNGGWLNKIDKPAQG